MVVLWFSRSFMGRQQLKAAELSCHIFIFILFRFSNPFMPGQGVCCLCAAWIGAAPSLHNTLDTMSFLKVKSYLSLLAATTYSPAPLEYCCLNCSWPVLVFLQWLFRGCDPVQLPLVWLQSSSWEIFFSLWHILCTGSVHSQAALCMKTKQYEHFIRFFFLNTNLLLLTLFTWVDESRHADWVKDKSHAGRASRLRQYL